MKKCFWISFWFIFCTTLIFILPTIWFTIPKHQDLEIMEYDESDTPIKFTDHIIGAVMRNDTYKPCENPIEHACHVRYSVQVELKKYKDNVLKNIIDKKIKETTFYKSCLEFHNKRYEKQKEMIIESNFYIEQKEIIEKLKYYSQLEDIFNRLSVYGIKSPFELLYDLKGQLILRRGIFLNFESKENHFTTKFTELIEHEFGGNALSIYSEISNMNDELNDVDYEITTIRTDNFKNIFNFKKYLGDLYTDEIALDVNFIHTFNFKKSKFLIEQWKNYLKIAVIYFTLKHMRISDYSELPSDVCVKHYEELFPIHVCRHVRDDLQINAYPIQNMMKRIKSSYNKWIKVNPFNFHKDVMTKVNFLLTNLTEFVNKCWVLPKLNDYFVFTEDELIKSGKSYFYTITELYKHKKWRTYRSGKTNIYFKRLIRNFLDINAWYDPSYNMLIIPSVLLHFHENVMGTDSCLYQTVIGNLIGHEYFHIIYTALSESKSPEWVNFEKTLFDKFQINSDDELNEALADIFGTKMNFEYFESAPQIEKECFFLTTIREWCNVGKIRNHMSGVVRQKIGLYFLSQYYEKTFSCKINSL